MNFEEFRERMKAEASQKTGAEVFLKEVSKNNGVNLWGLSLRQIVSEVNREQVDVTQQLSDNVYVYKRETDSIEIA